MLPFLRDILTVYPIDISASKSAAEPESLMAYSGRPTACANMHY